MLNMLQILRRVRSKRAPVIIFVIYGLPNMACRTAETRQRARTLGDGGGSGDFGARDCLRMSDIDEIEK